MGKGLSSGSFLFTILGCFAGFTLLLPPTSTWIVTREEVFDHFCWSGEGFFQTNIVWGDEKLIDNAHFPSCNVNLWGVDSSKEYCSSSSANNNPFYKTLSSDFRKEMCDLYPWMRLLTISGFILALFALFLSRRCFFIRDLRRERARILFATFFCLLSASMLMLAFILVNLSSMYSKAHIQYLGRNNRVNFDGFGCVFQSPFVGGFFSLLKSAPIRCIFPGPSFALSLTASISLFIASIFHVSHYVELGKQLYPDPDADEEDEDDIDDNSAVLLAEGDDANNHQVITNPSSSSSSSSSSFVRNDEEGSYYLSLNHSTTMNGLHQRSLPPAARAVTMRGVRVHIPISFFQKRRYSLHGSMIRRLHTFPIWERYFIASLVPLIALATALLFAWWAVYGIQYVVAVNVGDVKLNSLNPNAVLQLRKLGPRSFQQVHYDDDQGGSTSSIFSNLVFNILHSSLMNISESALKTTEDGKQFLDNEGIVLPTSLLKITEQVYDFDPINSARQFWIAGAKFISVITIIWLDVFPFLKVVIWIFCWYLPMHEAYRGRILTWLDALSKWTFSNLFCLCIMNVAFLFDRHINIPIPFILQPGHVIGVHIQVSCVTGRATAWMVGTLLSGMLHGTLMLELHTRCAKWERERRSRKTKRKDRHNMMEGDIVSMNEIGEPPSLTSGRSNDNRSSFSTSVDDTPFLDDSSHPHHTTQTLGTTSTIQQQDPISRQDSIFFVRRNSTNLFNQMLGKEAFCDEKLALWNKAFAPVHHQRHRFTTFAKILSLFLMTLGFVLTILSVFFGSISLHRGGALGFFLVPNEQHNSSYSVWSFWTALKDAGIDDFAICVLLFTIIIPILHIFGLFVMWVVPMTTFAQDRWFRVMEFLGDYSMLDVFTVSILVSYLDIEDISKRIVGVVVPGLNQVAADVLKFDGLFIIDTKLKSGFFFLVSAVILEKITTYSLLQISAMAIAERKLHTQYRHGSNSNPQQQHSTLLNSANDSGNRHRVTGDQLIEDLLQVHDGLEILSPADRYVAVSAAPRGAMYAGVPRIMWRIGVAIHLLSEETNNDYQEILRSRRELDPTFVLE